MPALISCISPRLRWAARRGPTVSGARIGGTRNGSRTGPRRDRCPYARSRVLSMRFEPTELTDAELAPQREVREFLAAELPRGSFTPGLGMGAARDPAFSRKLAARGW